MIFSWVLLIWKHLWIWERGAHSYGGWLHAKFLTTQVWRHGTIHATISTTTVGLQSSPKLGDIMIYWGDPRYYQSFTIPPNLWDISWNIEYRYHIPYKMHIAYLPNKIEWYINPWYINHQPYHSKWDTITYPLIIPSYSHHIPYILVPHTIYLTYWPTKYQWFNGYSHIDRYIYHIGLIRLIHDINDSSYQPISGIYLGI